MFFLGDSYLTMLTSTQTLALLQKSRTKTTHKINTEKEQEVAEALFDLANLATFMDDGVSEGPKRKRMKSKRDISAEKDGSEGKRADEVLGKRSKEENIEKVGTQGNAAVTNSEVLLGTNPLSALFPNAVSAMAAHLCGGVGTTGAMSGAVGLGWPPPAGFSGRPLDENTALAGNGALFGLPPGVSSDQRTGMLRGKHCAMHVYIAHFIDYQQQVSRQNLLQKHLNGMLDGVRTDATVRTDGLQYQQESAVINRRTESRAYSGGEVERQDAPTVFPDKHNLGSTAWPLPPTQSAHAPVIASMFPPQSLHGDASGQSHTDVSAQQLSQYAMLHALMSQHGGFPFGSASTAVNPMGGMLNAPSGVAGPGSSDTPPNPVLDYASQQQHHQQPFFSAQPAFSAHMWGSSGYQTPHLQHGMTSMKPGSMPPTQTAVSGLDVGMTPMPPPPVKGMAKTTELTAPPSAVGPDAEYVTIGGALAPPEAQNMSTMQAAIALPADAIPSTGGMEQQAAAADVQVERT